MRPPHELNGDWDKQHIIPSDDAIDLKFNARVVRPQDEPPEFAKSRSVVLRTQTVSMDTHFFRITSKPCSVFAPVFGLGLPPLEPFPSPPPPMRRARARCSSARRPNLGMGFAASLHHARPQVRWPG